LISGVTLLKNVSSHAILKNPNFGNKERADVLSRNLAEGITKLLNTREILNRNNPQNRPTNQAIASLTFDIAKHTKELVTLLS